ncbi:hypothetical protein BJV78DRAFT_908874 [Lactifluus subvellereus]|nr:hypothetical protein BJV78DRAFT_908874 [Lactifluus subvellereus]
MAETRGPTAANKLALSRALGAAFLTHQVEQLEKSVSAPPPRPSPSRSYNSSNNNWRDRQRPHPPPSTDSKRGQLPIGGIKITTSAAPPHHQQKERPAAAARKRGGEDPRKTPSVKEADVIIVDASVLVNALGQVKRWCRDGQEEVLIVPLEALNTLDLLKKGSTPLAQRARTASRVLESQVGTNPRVRVQQDDAFILWDKITFDEDPLTSGTNATSMPSSTSPSPEWVRRTICCAQWETEHADAARPRVVLATLAPPQSSSAAAAPAGDASQQQSEPATTSPVPLPAPHLAQQHRHEPRVTGTLVTHWARRARLAVLEVPPFLAATAAADDRASPEDRRSAHHHHHHNNHHHRGRGRGGGMVERPPAVKAMMEMVAQPTRVVRVLARGEKLDPDP